MDEIVKFKGEIVRQLYPNPLEDSDGDMYRIYAVNPTENDDGLKYNKYGNVAIKGAMYKKLLYKEYNIHAVLVKDGYGYGYEVKQIFEPKPETQDEIKRFLGDILTPMQADEVYNTYPDIIDIVMEDRTDEIDLDKLYNIGKVRIKIIIDKIERNFKFIDISTKLIDYGLKHKDIKQIYEMSKYNSDIVNDFQENPYKYMCDILRYRFNRADAKIMRVDPQYYDSYERLKYAVHYIINDKNNGGDTILNYDRVRTGLQEIDYRLLSIFDLYDEIDGVKYTEKGITTESMYEMEKYIYNKLKSANDNIRKWDVDLDKFKGDSGFELTNEQSQAIEYTAVKNAHVLVGFAGCVDSETEYFNGTKWVKISEYKKGDKVLQYNNDGSAELVVPDKYHKYKLKDDEKMTLINNKSNQINQVLSDNHNFVYLSDKGNINISPFYKIKERYYNNVCGFSGRIISDFKYGGSGINYTDQMIKLKLAVYADGSIYKLKEKSGYDRIRFHIKKSRKKKELLKLFEENNLEYKEVKSSAEGYTDYYIDLPEDSKQFDSEWYSCSERQLELIADNILQWDGSVGKLKGRKRWSTTIKSDADFIQFVFTSVGYPTNIGINDRTGQEYLTADKIYTRQSIEYDVRISKRKHRRNTLSVKNHWYDMMSDFIPEDGYKYCFTVPSSMLVLRRDNNIFITGNSGKSFTTKTICDYLDSTNKKYALMSPTGVASDVLSEHTGRDAETIHRAMKYHPFKGFRLEKFYVDYVIMDELSMADTWLFYNVLQRIDFSQTKLLLIGDSGQLSSVGSGTILYDIVSNNLLPVTTLTKVFRYDSGGMAQINTDTRNGNDWLPKDNKEVHVYGEDNDFIYYDLDGERGLEKLIDVYMMLLEDNPPEDIRVMTAYKIKQYGSNRINNILQKLSNPKTPDKKSIKIKNIEFIEGDMVIHKKNNYEIKGYMLNKNKEDSDYEINTVEIFNGKRGRIKSIDNNIIYSQYPRRVVCYNTKEDEIFELKLSYASSIHSSQGAQCKNVILFVPSDHSNMITSNLLYTGLSRAQERVILIGENSTIREGLKRSVNLERETNLRYLAQGIYDEN